jgi:DNA (cytosine-5)-methyltransferase 1
MNMEKLHGLDLFSGIGGITVALNPWVNPVAYVEQDPYCQRVLFQRMVRGQLPGAPIWDDVRTLDRSSLGGTPVRFDIMYGGFPCQDLSVAGAGKGLDGNRSGLFFEITRLAREVSIPFIFLENVPAIRTRGLDRVLRELASMGYDCRWTSVSADYVGAPHRRERWFLLAYSDGARLRNEQGGSGGTYREGQAFPGDHGKTEQMANDDLHRRIRQATPTEKKDPQGFWENYWRSEAGPFGDNWWATEPGVGRVADGLPNRVDRCRALGNAVVPAQVREAFSYLAGIR